MTKIYAQLDTQDIVVLDYPLTIYQIRGLYPDVSWADDPTTEILATYHLVEVILTDPPAPINRKYIVIEGDPAKDITDGLWYQVWLQQLKKSKK